MVFVGLNWWIGFWVIIECKVVEIKDYFVIRGSGEVDEIGKFSFNILYDDMVGEDGNLKEVCYV